MNRVETLAEIRDYSAFALANDDLADCGSPDDRKSPGGQLLIRTRDSFLEFIDGNPQATADDIREEVGTITADMVSVYTHEKWKQFIDLGAYLEESESGEWPPDLSSCADVALYQILERMVYAFAQMIEDAEEDETDEDA